MRGYYLIAPLFFKNISDKITTIVDKTKIEPIWCIDPISMGTANLSVTTPNTYCNIINKIKNFNNLPTRV